MRKYENFLNEKKKVKDNLKEEKESKKIYGCAMLYFKTSMKDIHDKIDKDDIYDEHGLGLEKNTHLTLLYGFHYKEVDEKDIFETILNFDITELELYNVSSFENKENEYDVLKFDVRQKMEDYDKKEDFIFEINKELTEKYPFTTDFPDYHPHSTIAYLKKGKAKKYIKIFEDEVYSAIGNKIVYSVPKSGIIKKQRKINEN